MHRKCNSIEYIPFFSFFVIFIFFVCLFAFRSIELISNDVICKFYTQQVGNRELKQRTFFHDGGLHSVRGMDRERRLWRENF